MRTMIAIALGAALGAGGFGWPNTTSTGDVAKIKSLLEQDVSEKIDGKEARVSAIEVSYGPGASPRPPPPRRGLRARAGGRVRDSARRPAAAEAEGGRHVLRADHALHSVSRNPSKTAITPPTMLQNRP